MRHQWLLALIVVVGLGSIAAHQLTARGKLAKEQAVELVDSTGDDSSESTKVLDAILKEPSLPTTETGSERPVSSRHIISDRPAIERWDQQKLPRGSKNRGLSERFSREDPLVPRPHRVESQLRARYKSSSYSIESIECRTSVCRLVVVGKAEHVASLLENIAADKAKPSDVGGFDLVDDKARLRLFLVRP